MPRIQPRLFTRAAAINQNLPCLLPVCRDLRSARNELRWLRERAIAVSQQMCNNNPVAILHAFTLRRALGEPLQYILGSEYFGDLDIKCRPGVLIPRPETAASVCHLVSLLNESEKNGLQSSSPLRVLDLCTGSGCIPLLFHHEHYRECRRTKPLELVGIDVSSEALSLARENLIYHIATQGKKSNSASEATKSLQGIGFVKANVLAHEEDDSVDDALKRLSSHSTKSLFDIVISNPPYISPLEFETTPRSVRKYEPRLALVPPRQANASDRATADIFYPKLLGIAENVQAKLALLEVSDLEQAKRVISTAMHRSYWDGMEIWRDDPSVDTDQEDASMPNGHSVKVRGSGHGRSVFLYRNEAAAWASVCT